MINIVKKDGKLIGIYEIVLSNEELMMQKDIKKYIVDSLMNELNKEDNSDLFTYNILEVNECTDTDLYGRKCGIVFEFVPNAELVEELKLVAERLQIGL
jgi:hypothetical protein